MRHFRLLSFIVAMLVAGVILGLNLEGHWRINDDALHYIGYVGFYEYGFPFAAKIHNAWMFPVSQEKITPQDFAISEPYYFRRHKEGLVQVDRENIISSGAFAVNLLILLAAAALALFACESFLRRRESRAHASRRSTTP